MRNGDVTQRTTSNRILGLGTSVCTNQKLSSDEQGAYAIFPLGKFLSRRSILYPKSERTSAGKLCRIQYENARGRFAPQYDG